MSGLFTGLLRIEFAPHNIASFDWIRTKAPFEPRILGLEDEETGKKGDFDDALFGCDFHPPIGSPSKQRNSSSRTEATASGKCDFDES